MTRARRMAEATGLPMRDRRAPVAQLPALEVGGVRVPRAGDVEVVIDGRVLRLTNLDRVLWPETGFTKAELVAYFLAVADVMLRHLRDRPLTLGRFPGGVDGRGFAQTEAPGRPPWVRTVPLDLANGARKRFTVADDRATLVWLAQIGTVELHTFLGAWPEVDRPRAVVFDLDPPPSGGLLAAADVACALRDRLTGRGLAAFPKTSGSAGLHVLVPLAGAVTYAETRAFATSVAAEVCRAMPDRATVAMVRAARGGRVLIDVRQNARRLTMIAAYSLRATPRPTASVPVTWSEIDDALAVGDAARLVFPAATVVARIADVGDPLATMCAAGRRLP